MVFYVDRLLQEKICKKINAAASRGSGASDEGKQRRLTTRVLHSSVNNSRQTDKLNHRASIPTIIMMAPLSTSIEIYTNNPLETHMQNPFLKTKGLLKIETKIDFAASIIRLLLSSHKKKEMLIGSLLKIHMVVERKAVCM